MIRYLKQSEGNMSRGLANLNDTVGCRMDYVKECVTMNHNDMYNCAMRVIESTSSSSSSVPQVLMVHES